MYLLILITGVWSDQTWPDNWTAVTTDGKIVGPVRADDGRHGERRRGPHGQAQRKGAHGILHGAIRCWRSLNRLILSKKNAI